MAFVCADADIAQAATGLAWSSFYTHGQSCVSTERIFVDEKIVDKFIPLFKAKIKKFQDEMQKMGACSSLDESRLIGMIEEAKEQGADVFQTEADASGASDGFFGFTMISGPAESMQVFREEIFGPAVAVQAVPDFEEAIARIKTNHPPMGVSIWSGNHKKAQNLAEKIPAGMIWINDSSFGLPHLPWIGLGDSERGMLFSEYSIREVTRLKWVSEHPARFSRARFWWNPYTSWKEKLLTKIAENFF
jgi:succinate-semialdehyde dehydrogenase/glutarate-semialdehyde dehydrogenase